MMIDTDKLVTLPLVQAVKSCLQSQPCTHTIEHSRSNLEEIDICVWTNMNQCISAHDLQLLLDVQAFGAAVLQN